ncbi:MAG: FIST C-terminal domain-containing protein [Burkholderiaceae bacterium]|nr:FIST C-terminal domain-containing protein [Burkholderiaceae bacterium]
MTTALAAHATHPDARMALALAAAQIEARRAAVPAGGAPFEPTLGLLYLSDRCADQAEALLADARQRWPGVQWAGCVGIGVIASGVEYLDEPALALLLLDLPAAQFRLFNGRQPMDARLAHTALVHADPATPDLAELIDELAGRTGSGVLFGGLAASRSRSLHIADGVFQGGLSGVAFDAGVPLLSRVTQGCQPVGPARRISDCDGNLVLALDGQPALPLLLADLGLTLDRPQQAVAVLRATLAGLGDPAAADDGDEGSGEAATPLLGRGGQFGEHTRVRHLIGIDPARQGVAIADLVHKGQALAFCRRDTEAARRDLVRICTEIRDELEAEAPAARRIAGAVYVSCSGRGGPHFGGPSAEALIVQHALGEVPLVGFFAAGEIARDALVGYTGVLTVFTSPA